MPGLQPKRMEEIVIEKPVPRKAHGLEPLRRQEEPDSSLPSLKKLRQGRPPSLRPARERQRIPTTIRRKYCSLLALKLGLPQNRTP